MSRGLLLSVVMLLGLMSGNALAVPTHLSSRAAAWAVRATGTTYAPSLHWADYVPPASSMRYVDFANGVDDASRDGSVSQPWKTPGYAVQRLAPGNVLNVSAGEYSNTNIDLTDLVPNGTASAPIVVRGHGPGNVVFKPTTDPSISDKSILDVQRSYWVFEDIAFDMNHQPSPAIKVSTPGAHVVIRRVQVRNSTAGSAVNLGSGAHDVAILESRIHDTWASEGASGAACTQHSQCGEGFVCDPGPKVCRKRKDGHGVFIGTGVYQVLVRDNLLYDNSGDGVQCEEGVGGNQNPRNVNTTLIPRDVILEGNEIYTTQPNWGVTENAIDLKACHNVSVRSSPLKRSSFHGFRPAGGAGSNNSSGAALVVHFEAKNVLIEDASITNSCEALSIGRAFDIKNAAGEVVSRQVDTVEDVTFRRNTVHGLVADFASDCSGKAVSVNRVDDLEVLNNTFYSLPATVLTLASGIEDEPGYTYPESTGVKVSSNIFHTQAGIRWVTLTTREFTSVESRDNLFWSGASQPTAGFYIDNATPVSVTGWRSTLQTKYGMTSTLTATERELDPLFAAQTAGDFPTQGASPARNESEPRAGEPSCGGAADVGAYESDCGTWVKQFSNGTPYGGEAGQTAARAPDGSLYVAGQGLPQGTTTTNALHEYFLMKLEADGDVVWSQQMNPGYDTLIQPRLAVDGQGNVYVTAATREYYDCQFFMCSEAVRALVMKYNSSGVLQWRREVGGRGQPSLYPGGIAVHASSEVYVGAVRGDTGPYRSNQDGLLFKLDASTGQVAWTHILTLGALSGGVAVGASGEVFVAGYSEGQVELNPVPYLSCPGVDLYFCKDMFVARFDSNGNRLWVRRYGGMEYEHPTDIAVGPSGQVYVGGRAHGSWAAINRSGPNSPDFFAARFSPSTGDLVWVRQFGGGDEDYAGEIQVDATGALYIVGMHTPTFTGAPSSSRDVLVLKYDANGELRRGWVAGTAAVDWGYGLVLDGQGFIATGTTNGPWGAPLVTTSSGSSSADAFIAREVFLR